MENKDNWGFMSFVIVSDKENFCLLMKIMEISRGKEPNSV